MQGIGGAMKNKLFYYNSEVQVLAGDHVLYSPVLFGKKKRGRVSYIPRKTARELAQEKKQADDWIIEFDDGTVTGWIYSPEDLQPAKRLKFLSRKDDQYSGPSSDDLEKAEGSVPNE